MTDKNDAVDVRSWWKTAVCAAQGCWGENIGSDRMSDIKGLSISEGHIQWTFVLATKKGKVRFFVDEYPALLKVIVVIKSLRGDVELKKGLFTIKSVGLKQEKLVSA